MRETSAARNGPGGVAASKASSVNRAGPSRSMRTSKTVIEIDDSSDNDDGIEILSRRVLSGASVACELFDFRDFFVSAVEHFQFGPIQHYVCESTCNRISNKHFLYPYF